MSTERAVEAQSEYAEQRRQFGAGWWERAPEFSSEGDEEAEVAEAALFEAVLR